MKLKKYQQRAFNKMLLNDQNFIFWYRQYGKTHLITHYIEHYVDNNYGQDILCISNNLRESKYIMNLK